MAESSSAEHLAVQIRHRIGALRLDVEFGLTKPWTVLFGPSGSGKTTILRILAGLLQPDHAHIVSSSQSSHAETILDTDHNLTLAPHRRNIPMAPQKPTLFPHLTVRENLDYGRTSTSEDRQRDHAQTADLPALFRVDTLLRKFPRELSGGEAQRVSLARAAMAMPSRLLLFDEPFTGLDIPLRDSLLADLLRWQSRSGVPILSVTHDIAEAFLLDAEVIKLCEGRVLQQGPVATVLAQERSRLLDQLRPVEQTPASPVPAPAEPQTFLPPQA